jgi:hypothetical protein
VRQVDPGESEDSFNSAIQPSKEFGAFRRNG